MEVGGSWPSEAEIARLDLLSKYESSGSLFIDKEGLADATQQAKPRKPSSSRRCWVALCWILTWWLPSILLIWVGRMRREDVRQAWREKLALNMIIWLASAGTIVSVVLLQRTAYVLVPAAVTAFVLSIKVLPAINTICSRSPSTTATHDKFVICQLVCYTEGEESLTPAINSLAKLDYDDKRKLIVVICDGLVIGSGNDRPTSRIVLDILGVDSNIDPEPLVYHALGEGARQVNYAKAYAGLYECDGHIVPYLVVTKVGFPTERTRPGNRGKRDSQVLMFNFLNKVHYNAAMSPLELEMYHLLKNVIGVQPSFYEFLFTIDADTTVEPASLNALVSAMINDVRVIGACGETKLSNETASLVTSTQVHEYHRSFRLTKAFESLFGSVTCLPGCFSIYRLRNHQYKPLLISHDVIRDYSVNRVDTLHLKNLLLLGEDRYLTTLLLKHFPTFKTQFVRNAFASTVAPETWTVLSSQRRRWTNSTVHNLVELLSVQNLCGMLCCSLRFIVLLDLVATVTQPVTVAYVVYLVHLAVTQQDFKPKLSLIMIAAAFVLQLLFFIFGGMLGKLGWMIVWIMARPAYSFLMPLYAFWRMDDFTWGETRVSLDMAKIVENDEDFDPALIPLKSWDEYQNELWERVPTPTNYSEPRYVPPQLQISDSGKHEISVHEPGAPSDADLENAIREVLQTANLMSVTKKDIRRILEKRFQTDLGPRRTAVNAFIDRALTSK